MPPNAACFLVPSRCVFPDSRWRGSFRKGLCAYLQPHPRDSLSHHIGVEPISYLQAGTAPQAVKHNSGCIECQLS